MTKFSAALLGVLIATSAGAAVEKKTDRFTGDRSVSYASIPAKGQHALSTYAFYAKDSQRPTFVLHLLTWDDHWRYLDCKSNNWLLDGRPEPALAGRYENSMASSATIERFVYVVPPETMKRIADSQVVEFKLCNDEGVVSAKDMEGLREVLKNTE